MLISSYKGHIDVVRELLTQADIEIEYKDLDGVTALWAACKRNNHEIVELLLYPRNVRKSHRKQLSLTNFSNLFGDDNDDTKEEINFTSKGANPNSFKYDGKTPLFVSASLGYTECMKLLIAYGADLNKPENSEGTTPLFVACQNGKKLAVDILLSANVDVNKPRSSDGWTALMAATDGRYESIVDVLLKSGADPMQRDREGFSAFALAARDGYLKIVKLQYDSLLIAKDAGEIVDFVNAGDDVHGWTALHLACMGGHEDVIKYLVNIVTVDIFKKDYENKTGIEHAWQNGHQHIVQWLSTLESNIINR